MEEFDELFKVAAFRSALGRRRLWLDRLLLFALVRGSRGLVVTVDDGGLGHDVVVLLEGLAARIDQIALSLPLVLETGLVVR